MTARRCHRVGLPIDFAWYKATALTDRPKPHGYQPISLADTAAFLHVFAPRRVLAQCRQTECRRSSASGIPANSHLPITNSDSISRVNSSASTCDGTALTAARPASGTSATDARWIFVSVSALKHSYASHSVPSQSVVEGPIPPPQCVMTTQVVLPRSGPALWQVHKLSCWTYGTPPHAQLPTDWPPLVSPPQT